MCGIVGFLGKSESDWASLGEKIVEMLKALSCRGPDSAGVALYSSRTDGKIAFRVKLGEEGFFEKKGRMIASRIREFGVLSEFAITSEYLRFVVDLPGQQSDIKRIKQLIHQVEAIDEGVEVISAGRNLEVIKQVGSPQNLNATYDISSFRGTHGLGHTRLSTESKVDLSHSQPFWTHGHPDLAVVHNGHITNYHKLRRKYEQSGVKFYTDNDSEVIGIYLSHRLSEGMSLEEALKTSLIELDGSYSYLAATSEAIGFCKDPFAFKPLLFAETDHFVAVATEEMAIRSAFEGSYQVKEAQAKEVQVWRR